MQTAAQQARQQPPARRGVPVPRLPLPLHPLPQTARPSRLIAALRCLLHLLFVRPVGRRARAERLTALPERSLRDIGLRRADVQAAACGLVPLAAVMRAYPSAGPLCICGRPGFRPTVVRLGKAA
jgi:uncharacterized protein YjiS (DUF1127 family)